MLLNQKVLFLIEKQVKRAKGYSQNYLAAWSPVI